MTSREITDHTTRTQGDSWGAWRKEKRPFPNAPWDQANVSRFLRLLKEFSSKIQFLVVTHNPRTMEMTDILYGVTMQDFGISKIISTRLKKETPAQTKNEEQKEELAPA